RHPGLGAPDSRRGPLDGGELVVVLRPALDLGRALGLGVALARSDRTARPPSRRRQRGRSGPLSSLDLSDSPHADGSSASRVAPAAAGTQVTVEDRSIRAYPRRPWPLRLFVEDEDSGYKG